MFLRYICLFARPSFDGPLTPEGDLHSDYTKVIPQCKTNLIFLKFDFDKKFIHNKKPPCKMRAGFAAWHTLSAAAEDCLSEAVP